MIRIFIIIFFVFIVFMPLGVIADEFQEVSKKNIGIQYDFNSVQVYQVDGRSMENRGFMNGDLVKVIQASQFNIGDIIAFACFHEKCSGMYIKEIVGKINDCYWLEGRNDFWEENNVKKQSMDSRTTYGWLCNENIDIRGIVFSI